MGRCLLIVGFLAAPVSAGDNSTPSFLNGVLPTLTRAGCNSGACHGALAGKGGFRLSLRGYDPTADFFTLTRQALARRVDPADPDGSLMLQKATRGLPHGGGRRFDTDSDHYTVLRAWVAAGAPGPSNTDPTLVRLDATPAASRVKPADKLSVRVTATYSDGSSRDVTKRAKFLSSGEQVAAVDEDGQVTVAGHGEAGVSAMFGNRVATVTVTSPYPGTPDPAAFAARRANFVDDHVLAKLRALNLPPSPDCTDAEFVRRAFLDTCGVLPKPEEVDAFLNNGSADKRAKLIEQLLDRPEFVDYWAHKWSDLMLVSSRKLPTPAVWAFYRAVRRAVADNMPWDRFARDVLTTSGSTLAHGGGNFFLIHLDPTSRAEATAITFLGLSVGCAKCHNHPLEKWTQNQYWGFTNLFARVGLKNGPKPGEVIVRSTADGDALHPRTGVPVPPAPLDGPALAADSPTDRRQHLADWLTAPDNPFFAKAVVNRVWKNFLGRALVEAEDDMRDTNPPTNRELLDALAKDFVTRKFDVKHLCRTILNSATYQRSSRPLPANAADDRFYSHYLVRRLPAEVILDAYTDVTGVPTPFSRLRLGPSGGDVAANLPRDIRAVQLPDSQLVSRFLDSFGRAEREQACACERTADSSVAQALHLNNGQTLNDKLRDPNSRIAGWLSGNVSDDEIVTRVFRLALCRSPSAAERVRFTTALADASKAGPQGRREAVEDVVWAVLTGKEFLFNR